MKIPVSMCSTPGCGYYYGCSEMPLESHKKEHCSKCGNESRKLIVFNYTFYKAAGEK